MKKKLLFTIIFFLLFLVVTCFTITNKLNTFDNGIYNLITNNRSLFLDNYFKLLTKFGNSTTIIIIMSLFLIILKKKNRIKLATILLSSASLNNLLKMIIKRSRPNNMRLIAVKGMSYPSGHAMGSMALYGFLIYLVYKKIKNKYLKVTLIILLSYLIITIGISRIYLGVHYASDILGGYLLSITIILSVNIICDKLNIKGQ